MIQKNVLKISGLIVAIPLLFSGCDGLHRSRTNIDFTANKVSSSSGVLVNHPNELFPLVEALAKKHGMKCNPYDEAQKYFGCGVGGFNLLTYVNSENSVLIELSEFGPWGETKQYQALKVELSEMLGRLYPGQGIALQSVPLK
jgi:hypothetical protein